MPPASAHPGPATPSSAAAAAAAAPPERVPTEQPKRRRGGVACRRCRRLRSKCLNQQARPPCDACRAAGPDAAAACTFPARGEDSDRQFRRRSLRVSLDEGPNQQLPLPGSDAPGSRGLSLAGWGRAPSSGISSAPPTLAAPFAALFPLSSPCSPPPRAQHDGSFPPSEEVIDGCRTFVASYFQLGFLPKAIFIESLVCSPDATSRFLLGCILSISSRFTPSLVRRYGSPAAATDYFLEASRAMASTEMYQPSLDRTQAFFLLAIAEWGNGDRDRSSMDMGVAVRMATLLKLHREETYSLPPDAPADEVVRAESARRTFWMIQSQENLHSGHTTPAPFPLGDITALLPCDEADFAFGNSPADRAALSGTLPALLNPRLATLPHRCLFATLVQAHEHWGQVARCAGGLASGPDQAEPWESQGKFCTLTAPLRAWEDGLPAKHKWSVRNLRGWRAQSLHLAYLSVVMVVRLSNIVIRRIYLERIISALSPASPSSQAPPPDAAPPGFWKQVSYELFDNVLELHEQVDAYFSMRTRDEGFPAILVFCVYMCGSLSSYLGRHLELCPHISQAEAQDMALSSLKVLSELHQAWPTSAKWQRGLQHIASPLSGVELPHPGDASGTPRGQTDVVTMQDDDDSQGPSGASQAGGARALDQIPGETDRNASHHGGRLDAGDEPSSRLSQAGPFLNDHFNADLAAFLSGEFQYGLLDNWSHLPG